MAAEKAITNASTNDVVLKHFFLFREYLRPFYDSVIVITPINPYITREMKNLHGFNALSRASITGDRNFNGRTFKR